jgi:hypothetical protein
MRATRDLLCRRTHLARTRGELLAHVQYTNSQGNLPAIGNKTTDKANRDGVGERFTDPTVQKSLAVDLARIGYYDVLLRDLELAIARAARYHDANTLSCVGYGNVPGEA